VSVVQEAYVAGVSTRKVDQIVESLALRISRSVVRKALVLAYGVHSARPSSVA
jgi:transposase-like protein